MKWLMICKSCGQRYNFEEQVSECPECKSTEIRFEEIRESDTIAVSNKVGQGLSDKTKGILGMIGISVLGVVLIILGIYVISIISPYRDCSIWCWNCCFNHIPKSTSELVEDYMGSVFIIIIGSFLLVGALATIVKRRGFLTSHDSRLRGIREKKYREKSDS